ncbi:MAG: ROK family protein, partial [Candidatus Omnitrophica bacterium]|nr:ROK family protein [Candidatus Omnitrophota bacterium]
PIFLDNDVNLMALAEQRLGAAKGFRNVVCLTLGTGVGGGLVINKAIYRGSTFAAGEIGHLPLNEKGPRCSCGGRGCLEAYIGNTRIIQKARRLFKRRVFPEELSYLAKKKNKKAIRLWNEMGEHLGIALCGVINLLNPDAIVIGGGLAGAGKVLFDKVKKTIFKRAMSVQARYVRVMPAKLGSDAGLIGAAILVKEFLEVSPSNISKTKELKGYADIY